MLTIILLAFLGRVHGCAALFMRWADLVHGALQLTSNVAVFANTVLDVAFVFQLQTSKRRITVTACDGHESRVSTYFWIFLRTTVIASYQDYSETVSFDIQKVSRPGQFLPRYGYLPSQAPRK